MGFLSAHASYAPHSGLFAKKSDAIEVAALLRIALDARFNNFNPLTVVVSGKGSTIYIEVPRLRYHWFPKSGDDFSAIADEMGTLANMYEKELGLERKPK